MYADLNISAVCILCICMCMHVHALIDSFLLIYHGLHFYVCMQLPYSGLICNFCIFCGASDPVCLLFRLFSSPEPKAHR